MNDFKIFYQNFRELYVFKSLSDFEIIFWVFFLREFLMKQNNKYCHEFYRKVVNIYFTKTLSNFIKFSSSLLLFEIYEK